MHPIPAASHEFTVDWLNSALAGSLGSYKIVSADSVDSDVPGQTAEIARISVTYDSDESPLPTRFVAKYTCKNRMVIEGVINATQLYWRETSFYQEFPDPGIPIPTCHYVRHDPASQTFVILMSDLSPATSPSWATTPAQVAHAVAHLPAMHAKWWNSATIRSLDWLLQGDDPVLWAWATSAAVAARPRVTELFGDGANSTLAAIDLFSEKLEAVLRYIGQRPLTLVHGDYHPKQLFFPSEAGGQFTVLDWQFSFAAQGAWDLARMMTMGQSVEDRRAREGDLIAGYYQGLLDGGVTGYSMADLEDDIRIGLLVSQMTNTNGLGQTDIAVVVREFESLGLDWRDVLLRGEAALNDWDVLSLLSKL